MMKKSLQRLSAYRQRALPGNRIGLWGIPPFIFLLSLVIVYPLFAQERLIGEGEHRGIIVNEGKQVLRVSPIKPGQTIQAIFTPQWTAEKEGKVAWRLEDQDGVRLRAETHNNPEAEPIAMEWTSNSEPKPSAYLIHVGGMNGTYPGEILGGYTLQILLWDQNDGNSGTDAPEAYEKALLLPVSEPGTYLFEECFISATADVCDIYKIIIKPNHSLALSAQPLQWGGGDQRGKVRWEFLNKSLRRLKEGSSLFPETTPFGVKVFHPRVKPDTKPALFYVFVKVEGGGSLIYVLHIDVKEGQ